MHLPTKTRGFRLRFLLASLLLALVVIVGARGTIGRAMGGALVAEDPEERADVIVVPQWTQTAGALEAADLVHRGMGASVLVLVKSEEPSTRELVRRGIQPASQSAWLVTLVKRLGVQTVDQIEGSDGGTRAEAAVLAAWCRQNRIGSLIVVTTLDHSRRVGRVMRRAMAENSTRVIIRPTCYARFDPDGWWHSRDDMRTEIIELEKLLADFVLHPFS
jgi:uncharacterized SAM-binding protein YcdF (DUF218 family)